MFFIVDDLIYFFKLNQLIKVKNVGIFVYYLLSWFLIFLYFCFLRWKIKALNWGVLCFFWVVFFAFFLVEGFRGDVLLFLGCFFGWLVFSFGWGGLVWFCCIDLVLRLDLGSWVLFLWVEWAFEGVVYVGFFSCFLVGCLVF